MPRKIAGGYDYVKDQLCSLKPIDKYGMTVKVTSASGSTKWMTLDVLTAKKILALAKGEEKLNKSKTIKS